MVRSKNIIAIGMDTIARQPSLLSALEASGFDLVEVTAPEHVFAAVEEIADPVIVVYNDPQQNTARRVLEVLASHRRKVPVIVIVDRSDFQEYYELMCEGAFDYFDLAGDPGWIENSLRAATQAAAA